MRCRRGTAQSSDSSSGPRCCMTQTVYSTWNSAMSAPVLLTSRRTICPGVKRLSDGWTPSAISPAPSTSNAQIPGSSTPPMLEPRAKELPAPSAVSPKFTPNGFTGSRFNRTAQSSVSSWPSPGAGLKPLPSNVERSMTTSGASWTSADAGAARSRRLALVRIDKPRRRDGDMPRLCIGGSLAVYELRSRARTVTRDPPTSREVRRVTPLRRGSLCPSALLRPAPRRTGP